MVDASTLTHDQSGAADKHEEPVLCSTSRPKAFFFFFLTVSESPHRRGFHRHLVVAGGGRERRGLCQETLGVRAGREDAPDVLGETAVLQTPQKVGAGGLL